MAIKKRLTGELAKNLEANKGNLEKAADLGRPRKEKTVMFSCRMKQGKLEALRDYCTASGDTITGVVDKAVTEYMQDHELTESQRAVFEALQASKAR